MKQKDIALIAAVIVVSFVVALVASNFVFSGSGANRQLTAEKVNVIQGDLPQPSNKYFNEQSVDPTELIEIDANANQTPFKQGTE